MRKGISKRRILTGPQVASSLDDHARLLRDMPASASAADGELEAAAVQAMRSAQHLAARVQVKLVEHVSCMHSITVNGRRL